MTDELVPPGAGEPIELFATAQLLDTEVERIDFMRIDQQACDPGAAEHGGRGRAGKAAADDRNVGVPHGESQPGCDTFHPEWQRKA